MDQHGQRDGRRHELGDLVPAPLIEARNVDAVTSQFDVDFALLGELADLTGFFSRVPDFSHLRQSLLELGDVFGVLAICPASFKRDFGFGVV